MNNQECEEFDVTYNKVMDKIDAMSEEELLKLLEESEGGPIAKALNTRTLGEAEHELTCLKIDLYNLRVSCYQSAHCYEGMNNIPAAKETRKVAKKLTKLFKRYGIARDVKHD